MISLRRSPGEALGDLEATWVAPDFPKRLGGPTTAPDEAIVRQSALQACLSLSKAIRAVQARQALRAIGPLMGEGSQEILQMSTSPHHPFASKLDLASAERIRARYAAGEAPRALAAEYGVAQSSIYDVIRGRAHAPRLVVPLTSIALSRLHIAARAVGATDETFAAALIEGALASLPAR